MPVRDWDKIRRQQRASKPVRRNPVAASAARRKALNKARKKRRQAAATYRQTNGYVPDPHFTRRPEATSGVP